jgi:hypothetical protein
MAALVAATHNLDPELPGKTASVDGRHKGGHDEFG